MNIERVPFTVIRIS